MAKGPCIPEFHGTIIIGEKVLGRLLPPGHCKDKRLKHIPNISIRQVYLLVLELQSKGKASGLAHTEALRATLREQANGHHLCTFPLPSYSSLVSPRKELIHLSEAPISMTTTQETPSYHLALVASGTYAYSPMGL